MNKTEQLNNVENLMVVYERLVNEANTLTTQLGLVEDEREEAEKQLFRLTNENVELRKAVNTFIEKVGGRGVWEE